MSFLFSRTSLSGAAAALALLSVVLSATGQAGPSSASDAHYEATWQSLDQHPLASWWLDAKFGIYVHWSLASVPSWGKHSSFYWPNLLKSRQLEANGPRAETNDVREEFVGLWAFHQRTYGSNFRFEDFAPQFRAEAFDARGWADLFARAGAKYVVLTTKHHDGFCLWPSAEANRSWGRPWNAADIGPRQDLVGALTEAVRRRGLKMGCYYSFYEWFNPLWLTNRQQFVDQHLLPQLKDLIVRYRPDILWADGEWEGTDSFWKSREFLAWLFNESPVPNIVIDDRWGQGCRHRHGGFYTTEFTAGMADGRHPWEENRTTTRPRAYDVAGRPLWYDWIHNRQLSLDNYYSARELVLTLVDTVSRGGNLLLNVGPTADGRIAVIEEERLVQIGQWLQVNGEAIFGTRPWKRSCQWSAGERPQVAYDQEWRTSYDIDALTAPPKPDRAVIEAFFTAKGKTLYAVVPRWPCHSLVLKDAAPTEPAAVSILGVTRLPKWKVAGADLEIDCPELPPGEIPSSSAYVFKITYLP